MKLRFVRSIDGDGQPYWFTESKPSEAPAQLWCFVVGSLSSIEEEAAAKFARLQANGGTFGEDTVLQEVTI